jgi:WD40 repeat protein
MHRILVLLFLSKCFLIKAQSPIPVIQTGHSGSINDVVFINDNEFVSAGEDGKLILWDVITNSQIKSFKAHLGNIETIKINEDYIISCSSLEKNIKVWDHQFNLIKEIGPFDTKISSFDILDSLNQLYIAGDFLYRYHMTTSKLDTLKLLSSKYFESVYAHDNLVLVGGGYDNHTILIDALNLKKVGIFKQISVAGFSNDDGIYLGGRYGNMKFYGLKDRKTKSLSLQSSFTKVNKVKEVGNFVVLCDSDGKLEVRKKNDFNIVNSSQIHSKSLNSFAISPNEKLIVTVGQDGKIFLRELETGWLLNTFISTTSAITDIKSYGYSNYAISYDDGSIRVWDVVTNTIHSQKIAPNLYQMKNNWHFLTSEIVSANERELSLHFYKVKTAENDPNQAIKIEKWVANWNYLSQEIFINKLSDKIDENPKGTYWKTYLTNDKIKSKKEQLKSLMGQNFIDENPNVNNYVIDDRLGVITVTNDDGIFTFYDIKSKQKLTNIALLGYSDFIYLDQSNYYFASKGALNFVGFKVGEKMISFQQFDIFFNRPDLVLSQLPFVSQEFISQLNKAVEKRHLKLKNTGKDIPDISELPQIKINTNDIKKTYESTFQFEIQANSKNNLEKLNILVDGVPVFDVGGKNISGYDFHELVSIELHNGLNSVDVYVEDEKGFRSLTLSFDIEGVFKVSKPDLYIVTIGASKYQDETYNLKYADKDANDIAALFKKNKIFKHRHELILTNEEVVLENLPKIEKLISKSKVQDVVLFFIAGHGVLDANYNYYLASYDMDFINPQNRGILYNDISEIFKNVKSRNKVILLDACHSGEIDTTEIALVNEEIVEDDGMQFRAAGLNVKSTEFGRSTLDLSKMLFADVSDSDGSTVISSASGTEYAMESSEWSNGLFTYCLIEGVKTKKADMNQDKKITINELRRYVNNRVQELSNGKQNPSSRIENIKNDFIIF